jgi:hypothetical protein
VCSDLKWHNVQTAFIRPHDPSIIIKGDARSGTTFQAIRSKFLGLHCQLAAGFSAVTERSSISKEFRIVPSMTDSHATCFEIWYFSSATITDNLASY